MRRGDAQKGPVATDLDRLRALLTRAGLAHVVCASGPGGGRHVWVALAQPITAAVVAGIARGLAAMLPSLDAAPLLNPRTGALRPPLAPHRLGGRSELLDGCLSDLLRPVVAPAQVLTFVGLIEAHIITAARRPEEAVVAARDIDGHRYLPGPRRVLSARAHAALHDALPATADASAVLATALCGAVRARWHLADVLALLPTAPGLHHARAERAGAARRPRTQQEQTTILSRQWNRAVDFVSTHLHRVEDTAAADPTFLPRCAVVVTAVAAVQRRADAAPGRWAQPGGPADRRVLDVACELMLAAVATDIELDTRRAGELAGICRSTAHLALTRLTHDGWLTPTRPGAGVHGAHWALSTAATSADGRAASPLSTPHITRSRTQVTPPPLEGALSARNAWRSHLAYRMSAVVHDAFTGTGLGHHAARVYQLLTSTPVHLVDLVVRAGYSAVRLRRFLDRLAGHRLAKTDRVGRWRILGSGHTSGRRLHRVAFTLGVAGVLVRRVGRHRIEREAWAWWLDELAWRSLPAAQKRRSPGVGQTVLPLAGHDTLTRHHRGPHPRSSNGRADFAAARRHLAQLPQAS